MSSTVDNSSHTGIFWTPPPKWETPRRNVPVMPRSESNVKRSPYHVRHKVPPGDSPYGIAKKVQLVDKDPSKAVSLFWAAINAGDRVDSALKDMAVVMRQLNRSDEAIEAIKSFRHLCPIESQESLDNVLLELYKRSRRLHEEIQMLQVKLNNIEEGFSFGGKRTKVGRSQGRKVHITIEKEYSRLVGNLAWAYLQQKDYRSAEEHYRKALSLEPDRNKQCNLAICLMHLNKMTEAKILLQTVRTSCANGQIDESFSRSFERATQILGEFESDHSLKPLNQKEGMNGEIQEPFLSRASRNLRGPSLTANANKFPGSEKLKSSQQVHQDEMLPLVELNRASSLLQNFHDSDINCFGSKSRNVNGKLCGGRRLSHCQKEEEFMCMKQYDATFSQAKTSRVLFTQPQKCLRLSNKDNHRRRWYAEESNSGCSRKLLFNQEKNSESLQLLPCHTIDQYKEPESARGLTSEDRREDTLGDPAKMNGESSLMSISFGVWKRDMETYERRNDTKDEFNLGSRASPGGYGTRTNEFSHFDEDCGQKSTSTVYITGWIEAAENGNQIQKSKQQFKTNAEYLEDFPESEKKKCWADMVEEDDQESLNESKDSLAYEQGVPSQAPLLHPKTTPNNYSDDGEAEEQFADENRNSNLIQETPRTLSQSERLGQNIESSNLKDGYYTQPLHADSSMNQMERRHFCCDLYRNRGRVRSSFVSPLQKRSLNVESDDFAPLRKDHTRIKYSDFVQRKKFESFGDITPESPKC